MGIIVRLDTEFASNRLKKINYRDTTALKNQILALPTLKSFYDATDKSTMTIDGGKVTELRDLKSNNHFTAPTSSAPTYNNLGLDGVGALSFDGLQHMRANGLFDGKQKGTIVVFGQGKKSTLSVWLSSSISTYNLYTRSGGYFAFSAQTTIVDKYAHIQKQQLIAAFDAIDGSLVTYLNGKSAVGEPIKRTIPTLPVNLGRWHDAIQEGFFVGDIGHIMWFDEDLSKNHAVLNLITEYAKQKYQLES